MYKTPSKKATIPSKKSYEVLQPNIAAGSRAFLKMYLNLKFISIYKFWRYIFKLHIIHYYKTRKRENLLQKHTVIKNWIPFLKSVDPIVSFWNLYSPYFLLVFLWPRFLSFSFATFNRSQEELFLSSLASNSDAKHLFKATFVIPEGRHYYILQRFFLNFAKYFDTFDSLWQSHISNWFLIEFRKLNKVKVGFFWQFFALSFEKLVLIFNYQNRFED